MVEELIKIVLESTPKFQSSEIDLPVSQTSLDSLDLIVVRVALEKAIGNEIPDHTWFGFKTIMDAISYCDSISPTILNRSEIVDNVAKRVISINMPNMAIEGLSENVLFRELGDVHWGLISRGMKRATNAIVDETGNRLYATFTRIQICSAPLSSFNENDELDLQAAIKSFGKGTFVTEVTSDSKVLRAMVMTTFSLREMEDNTRLFKSQPVGEIQGIPEYQVTPEFLNEYRLIKKDLTESHVVMGHSFNLTDEIIFESEYTLNPYYDINGVGLLYFAAYPTISDVCEARHCNIGRTSKWECDFSTVHRDIFYFANCNINDAVIYRLNSLEFIGESKVKILSALYRKRDMQIMARIFTVKESINSSS